MPLKKMTAVCLCVPLVFTFFLRHHFIHAKDCVLVIQKSRLTLHDTYVDVRQWNGDEWKCHDALTASLFKSSDN